MIALVLFVVLIALIMLGVPVGFALGGATIIIMQFFTKLDLSMVASYSVTGVDSLTMMAIPFFILSGVVMSVGGLARRLVDVAASLVGWMMGWPWRCRLTCFDVFWSNFRVLTGNGFLYRRYHGT